MKMREKNSDDWSETEGNSQNRMEKRVEMKAGTLRADQGKDSDSIEGSKPGG